MVTYTVDEVEELLHVSESTVLRLLHSGELRGFKVGTHRWRISQEELDDYIRRKTEEGETAVRYDISRNGSTVHLFVESEDIEKAGLCGGIREMEPNLDIKDFRICRRCPWYDSTADYFLDCKLYTPSISSERGNSNGVTREPDSYQQTWIDMNKEKFEEARRNGRK